LKDHREAGWNIRVRGREVQGDLQRKGANMTLIILQDEVGKGVCSKTIFSNSFIMYINVCHGNRLQLQSGDLNSYFSLSAPPLKGFWSLVSLFIK
jgi:hypothetical protein